jgi:hypothetical protein
MDAKQIVAGMVLAIFIVGPVIVVAWGWLSWFRHRPKPLPYGVAGTLTGFTLASFSALLNLGTVIYAQPTRGFRHYDPVLLGIYLVGLGLALVAVLSSFSGKNTESPLRLKAPVLSSCMLLIWFLEALTE